MSDISRRSIIKTAAWSVPAVTLATAAPAFATSDVVDPPTSVCLPGVFVKEKSNKGHIYTHTISSDAFPMRDVTAVSVRVGNKTYDFRFKNGVWTYTHSNAALTQAPRELIYHFGRKNKAVGCVVFTEVSPSPKKSCKKHGKKYCKKC